MKDRSRASALSALASLIGGVLAVWLISLFSLTFALLFAILASISSLVFGILAWRDPIGKGSILTLCGVLLLSVLFLDRFSIGRNSQRGINGSSILSKNWDEKKERIRRIGEDLLAWGPERGNHQVKGLLDIPSGLRRKLKEMRSNREESRVINVKRGDLPSPFGDGEADAILRIGNGKKDLQIRLLYDRDADAFRILGWRSRKPGS